MNKYVKGDVVRVESDRLGWPGNRSRFVGKHGVVTDDGGWTDGLIEVEIETVPGFSIIRVFHERDLNWGSPRKT